MVADAPAEAGRPATDAAAPAGGERFRLHRYFAIASLLCTLLTAAALGWVYQHLALSALSQRTEAHNAGLARVLSNALAPRFAGLVAGSPARSREAMQGEAEAGGLRGGTVHVELLQHDEGWNVSANGELQPAIPGINATLRARYADGAFTASVDTPFSIGERVSGTLLVGVSNLPSDSEGQPLEGATPGDSVMAFGHGTATVRLSDTLQGDFGIRVGTDAALAISGSVGIREPVTLFEQRRWHRELVRFPTVSIPIFGFAVGGNVVGIAATLGGGVDAEASVGPGQIDQGSIGITDFNPALPDSLHVTGRVRFVVPAQAGIAGHLDAGISAGAAVIRATGGLTIQLGLGVDAGVQTPIDLDWTAAQGLVLQATLQASATPRLRASVGGFAEVVADAFVTSFTLWRRDYTLAEREFGSALTVGVTVPVAWRQHGGLDFDFNRVQFQVPEISPGGALADLLRDGGNDQQRNDTSR